MERQYAETVDYFVPTPSEVKELQREAADLHDTVDDKRTSWLDRTRASERLKEVKRKIQTSRAADRRAEQQVRQVQVRQVQQRRSMSALPGYAVSDCGTAYIRVQNAEPQFAVPVVP